MKKHIVGLLSIYLTQSEPSKTRGKTRTALIKCQVTGTTAVMHWYRHKPGEGPERILYWSQYQGFIKQLFYHFTLFISSLETGSKLYTCFCKAFRHSESTYNKIFGSGTKLVVTSKYLISTPTAQGEMLHHVEDSKETYVCLVHNFFPNVIRMYWEDKEGKKISDNVVQGEVWPPREDADSYSVSSWLTVNKDSNKEYICQYEREGSVKQSVHTQLPTGISYIAKTVYIV
uniref:Ig-like domain-containing protein n=1 Tax=Crocodylus porosus TaxID=8502 RepID=A0A7M4FXT2_CROPO